jgi:hypothetical protein
VVSPEHKLLCMRKHDIYVNELYIFIFEKKSGIGANVRYVKLMHPYVDIYRESYEADVIILDLSNSMNYS